MTVPAIHRAICLLVFLPLALTAQLKFTVVSTADTEPYDNPDTELVDESADGTCADASGMCTLRAAIEEAANMGQSVEVTFSATGTITLTIGALDLPDGSKIVGSGRTVTIDGRGVGAALTIGNNSIIRGVIFQGLVAIAGDNNEIGDLADDLRNEFRDSPYGALAIEGNGNRIVGNVIVKSGLQGIGVAGNENIITGNLIGTDAAGAAGLGMQFGINILSGTGNRIGGTTAAERNVISGNSLAGIGIGGEADATQVYGNYIGVDPTGTTTRGNMYGIEITGMEGVVTRQFIGDGSLAGGNVISGNSNAGIYITQDGAADIRRNLIGVTSSASMAAGNTIAGILIVGNTTGTVVDSNVISGNGIGIKIQSLASMGYLSKNHTVTYNAIGGGLAPLDSIPNSGAGILLADSVKDVSITENRIVYNGGEGVAVRIFAGGTSSGNSIRKNTMRSNGGLGIFIEANNQEGVLPPILDSLVQGILYGHRGGVNMTIDVYYAASDPSGSGEGERWIASGSSLVDSLFMVPIGEAECPGILTATASTPNNSTSAFSNNLELKPEITANDEQLSSIFLHGIESAAAENEYTARINWNDAPVAGRKVEYRVNAQPWKEAELNGVIARWKIFMGRPSEGWIPDGVNTVRVRAISCFGESALLTINEQIVTKPDWILDPISEFTTTRTGEHLEYTIDVKDPDPEWEFSVSVPSIIPYVGGDWGLKTTQMTMHVKSSSSGAVTSDKVSFRSGFGLGSFAQANFTNDNGVISTRLQEAVDHIDIVPQSFAAFTLEGQVFSTSLSIFDVIPGASALHGVPVIGEIVDFASLSLTADIGADVQVHFDNTGGEVLFQNATFTPQLTFTGMISLGSDDEYFPASLTLMGRGRGQFDVSLPPLSMSNPSVSLTFSLTATAFGAPIGIINPQTFSYPSTGGIAVPFRTTAAGSPRRMLVDTLEQTIATGLPGDAQPRFAFDGTGHVAAIWNDVQGADPRPSGEIRAKLFDGAAWSGTHVLSLAAGSNFQPAAAFDGSGHLIVCWMTNAAAPFTDISQIASFAAGYDIAFAVVDAATGSVSDRGTFGIPLRAEFGARVVEGTDGSVHLVFASSDGASFSGTDAHPVSFHHTRWNGSSWEPLRTIAAGVTNVVSASVAAASSSEAQVALVRDMDGNRSTASDHDVFAARWNGTTWDSFTRVTNDAVRDIGVQAGYRSNGTPLLIWARTAEMVGIQGSLTSPVQSFLSLRDTASAEYQSAKLIRLPDGMALTWARAGSVFYSLSNSDASEWTPARMLPYTDAFERSVSSFLTADGRLHVGFLRSTVASDSTLHATSTMIVRSVDTVSTTTGAIDHGSPAVPNQIELSPAFPNPFNPATSIRYALPTSAVVKLEIYDMLGRLVDVVAEGERPAGSHAEVWDGAHMPSGLYLCRLEVRSADGQAFRASQKLMLLK